LLAFCQGTLQRTKMTQCGVTMAHVEVRCTTLGSETGKHFQREGEGSTQKIEIECEKK